MSNLVEESLEKLRALGLRVTDQRRAILSALDRSEAPKSAEEIHAALPEDTCDPVTAYRCLEQFEKADVVERGVRENGTKVYCLSHGHEHHHHLTCRKCGIAEKIDLCMGPELEKAAEGFGYTEVSHVMEVFGLCPSCA